MITDRLRIRPMQTSDENAFISGISDRSLRVAYGFPADLDAETASKIFHHFCALPRAFSITERHTEKMIGFLLEVDSELPAGIAKNLPGNGRTLAFAVFAAYQRQGYMEETLKAYIPHLLQNQGIDYIHCGHFPENEPSRKLLQKIGFQPFGEHAIHTKIVMDWVLPKECSS